MQKVTSHCHLLRWPACFLHRSNWPSTVVRFHRAWIRVFSTKIFSCLHYFHWRLMRPTAYKYRLRSSSQSYRFKVLHWNTRPRRSLNRYDSQSVFDLELFFHLSAPTAAPYYHFQLWKGALAACVTYLRLRFLRKLLAQTLAPSSNC